MSLCEDGIHQMGAVSFENRTRRCSWCDKWEGITLLSTVVAPSFTDGRLTIREVSVSDAFFHHLLAGVDRNLCGHPLTDKVLRSVCPSLPPQERAFWDGASEGLAVRPKGGVRGASQTGDTEVTLDGLEAVLVSWSWR